MIQVILMAILGMLASDYLPKLGKFIDKHFDELLIVGGVILLWLLKK